MSYHPSAKKVGAGVGLAYAIGATRVHKYSYINKAGHRRGGFDTSTPVGTAFKVGVAAGVGYYGYRRYQQHKRNANHTPSRTHKNF